MKMVKPKKKYFELFEEYKKIISKILPKAEITLIDSLAIPMLGKKEIDILIETENLEESCDLLTKEFPKRSPIVGNHVYFHDERKDIMVELHLSKKGSKKIKSVKEFIEKLKNNSKLKEKFEKFKLSCDSFSKEEYKKKKSEFMTQEGLIVS